MTYQVLRMNVFPAKIFPTKYRWSYSAIFESILQIRSVERNFFWNLLENQALFELRDKNMEMWKGFDNENWKKKIP